MNKKHIFEFVTMLFFLLLASTLLTTFTMYDEATVEACVYVEVAVVVVVCVYLVLCGCHEVIFVVCGEGDAFPCISKVSLLADMVT